MGQRLQQLEYTVYVSTYGVIIQFCNYSHRQRRETEVLLCMFKLLNKNKIS